MTIRKAHINDLPAMQRLFTDTIIAVCKNDYTEEQINAWASGAGNTKRWEAIIANQYVLVAEKDKILTGFGSLTGTGFIDLLYVHKDFLRQGIASLLLTALEKEAVRLGVQQLTAEVSVTARAFFKNNSFAVLQKQTIMRQGTGLINYKMLKTLLSSH